MGCAYCGAALSEAGQFCIECGAPIPDSVGLPPRSESIPGYSEFLGDLHGSKLLVSLEPGQWSKLLMGLGLGGLLLTGIVPNFTRKLAPQFYFYVCLISYLFTILSWVAFAYYRTVRPFQQRKLNAKLGNDLGQVAAPVLYLRPFSKSGRLLVRNPLESRVDRMLMGPLWDIELSLSLAVRAHYDLVAIGQTSRGLGSAKVIAADTVWKMTFEDAATRARVIFMIPHDTPGTIWEMEQIVARPEWLSKTVFFMPPTFQRYRKGRHAKDWERMSRIMQEKGIVLPSYDKEGQLFIMDSKSTWTCFPHHHLQRGYAFALISYLDYLRQNQGQAAVAPVQIQNHLSAIKVKEVNYSLDSLGKYTLGWLWPILFALLIKVFVLQAFKIPSGSMIPTMLIGDHILVSKLSYGLQWPKDCELLWNILPMNCYASSTVVAFEKPQRGDIIVFRFPEDEDKDFIKRIVGVPGDTIEVKNKTVLVNGAVLDDKAFTQRIDPGIIDGMINPRDNFGPVTVPEGSYFVMGDNRDQSLDSRFWGYVSEEKIKGKAFLIYWSWRGQGKWSESVRWKRIGRSLE